MKDTPRPIATSEYMLVAKLWYDAWHETQAPYVPDALIALRTKPDFLRRLQDMGDRACTIGPTNAPFGFCAIKDDALDQLFLHPRARGTGAATALITDAEMRLRNAGVTKASLDCLKENTPALRFYSKMGWTSEGVQSVVLDTSAGPFDLDCVVMTKKLL